MKEKVISITFIVFIIGFFVMSFVLEDEVLSKHERRKLTQVPKLDSDFISNLDDYVVDQFPLRNEFINLNSNINRNIWKIKDYNNVYVIGDTIYDVNYPLNEKECINFAQKVNYIIEKDLKNSNVYYSIIPDKEYFLEEEKYLKIDYELLKNNLKVNAKHIDITEKLSIDDYYHTDIHWKQENIQGIAETLVKQMGNEYENVEYDYYKYEPFYGASYTKGGSAVKPDELIYLKNEYTNKAKVTHLEYGEKQVYDLEKLDAMDSYDIFLSGASSFIEITNPLTTNDKELIMFRDSFASSLAPLLIPHYSKITLIDLRYINYEYVSNMVEFEGKDVLFIYSTQIINNSNLLKVKIWKNGKNYPHKN